MYIFNRNYNFFTIFRESENITFFSDIGLTNNSKPLIK